MEEIIKEENRQVQQALAEAAAFVGRFAEILEDVGKQADKMLTRFTRSVRLSIAKIKDMLLKQIKGFPDLLDEAFTVDSVSKWEKMSVVVGSGLSTALYQTQLRMEQLQLAIVRAAAPIAQAFLPLVNMAISALTALANTVGKVIEALLGGSRGASAYEKSLSGAIGATGKLQRSLAGFDQIERLGSTGSSGLSSALIPDSSTVIPGWQALAEKLRALLEPLKNINWDPAVEGLKKLYQAAKPIISTVLQALEWMWLNVLVPMGKWAAENVLPAFLEALTTALQVLNEVIEALRPTFTWLWENCLEKLLHYYADAFVANIEGITEKLQNLGSYIQNNIPLLDGVIKLFGSALGLGIDLRTDMNLWQQLAQTVMPIVQQLVTTMTGLPSPMNGVVGLLQTFAPLLEQLTGGWSGMKTIAGSALDYIKEKLSGLWNYTSTSVFPNVSSGTKQLLNSVIGQFEGMAGSVATAFNSLFRGISGNSVKLSSTIPGMGSAALQVKFSEIYQPKIPRLATGAVLPANKPFLAVVGDQKNGTNIEAPLSTIQQALGLALEDRLDGMMAGFQAVTSRQERILEAILGLDVSDGALYDAVARQERKLAMATGGV